MKVKALSRQPSWAASLCAPASFFPSPEVTTFHPIIFDPVFRNILAGDKILVDWKLHALTFSGYKVGGL
jgi:hypothetical protein